MSVLREENRRVLAARAPGLAERIAATAIPEGYTLARTPAGMPLLSVGGVALQHQADPQQDAARWARRAAERLAAAGATRAVVVGLGLGYHLEALAERFEGALVVVEPDLAVWRLALATRDLSALLTRATIVADADGTLDASPGERTRVLGYAPALLIPGGVHRRAVERWQASAGGSGLRLKILVVSPLYGGSWPIAGYVARAASSLGHDTQLLDLSTFHESWRGLERFGAKRARRGELEARLCDVLAAGVAMTVEATQPDIVLALAQAPLGAAALGEIGASGAIRVLWFVEDFRLFTYWRDIAAHYDYVFTIQEAECLEAIAAATDAHVSYLPCGFDPEIHRPLVLGPAERTAYGSDVAFVGAGYRNRRLAFRGFLDLDFRIWGSDWDGASDLSRVVQRGGARISTEEAVRIFNATRVNLNLHSSTYHDGIDPRGDFVNPRTFELAGAGAFQVVDARALLPPLFTAGTELTVASSLAEMRTLTEHYLAHADERVTTAAHARRRALAEHTYGHRLETLLGTVVGREQDRLLARSRTVTVGDVTRRGSGPLERFFGRFDPTTPLTLDGLVASLAEREGALEEPEAIFLFLHQFDELYLKEYRA